MSDNEVTDMTALQSFDPTHFFMNITYEAATTLRMAI
jgi:hypothetical protein